MVLYDSLQTDQTVARLRLARRNVARNITMIVAVVGVFACLGALLLGAVLGSKDGAAIGALVGAAFGLFAGATFVALMSAVLEWMEQVLIAQREILDQQKKSKE